MFRISSLTSVALHFFHSNRNYRFIVCMAFKYSQGFIVKNSSFNEIHGNTSTTHNHTYGEFPICRQTVAKFTDHFERHVKEIHLRISTAQVYRLVEGVILSSS